MPNVTVIFARIGTTAVILIVLLVFFICLYDAFGLGISLLIAVASVILYRLLAAEKGKP